MSNEQELAMVPDQETESQQEEAQPVDIEFIEDGGAFIKELNSQPAPELTEVVVGGKGFRIRKVGGHEVAGVLSAQYRDVTVDGASRKEYDALSTADRLYCKAIHIGVVKADGSPLWTFGQVTTMHKGLGTKGDHANKYTEILEQLYEEVIAVNPTLHPLRNRRAQQLLLSWTG